jgi:hypothetical protein
MIKESYDRCKSNETRKIPVFSDDLQLLDENRLVSITTETEKLKNE